MSIKRIQEHIKNSDFDAILVTGFENPKAALNVRYLTGYTGSAGAALIGADYKYIFSDFRYIGQVKLECPSFTFREISENRFSDLLRSVIETHQIKTIVFDGNIRLNEYNQYKEIDVTLLPDTKLIESFRMVKTKQEIEYVKRACEITDQAFDYILYELKPGVKEKHIEKLLKMKMIELGADNTWQRFIVASGARGSMPHGSASEKLIEDGDMVTLDMGCLYNGYYSDLTRTVAVGQPSEKMIEIYEIVKEAQQLGLDSAKAGMRGNELDKIVRDFITSKGYGDQFKHGLGHGLGLDIHENPRTSPSYNEVLPEGTIITIEPGIYIDGLGGVRIEDDVVLTKEGCIILNESPKDLIILK